MNLEGSLDAFGLADVVTLLANTGKSGALELRRRGPDGLVEGVVWFREGRLTGATSDRARASLVRRLVGSGAVDDLALRTAVARSLGGGSGVVRALVDAGAVDPALASQAAADQAVDAVFDLLRWPDGDFGFDPAGHDHDDLDVLLDPPAVLGEARARVEAWGQLEALVPGSDVVLALPVVLHDDPMISRDEWALLALVDARRTVRDLVELTGCGQFAVTTTLAQLVQRGLVHVRDDATPDHVSTVERRMGLLAALEATPRGRADRGVDAGSGPGALGMSAAAALAAARASHGPGAPGGRLSQAPSREVVPPRPEPFLPDRRPDHPEPAYAGAGMSYAPRSMGGHSAVVVEGATARALSDPIAAEARPSAEGVIERDPSVNRSLLLRLIAGVRGL